MIEDPFCAEKLLRISVRAVYGYIHDWPNLVFKLASEMGFRPSRLIGLAESNLGLALWPNLAQFFETLGKNNKNIFFSFI